MKSNNTVAKLFSSVTTLTVLVGAMLWPLVAVAGEIGTVSAWGRNTEGQCTPPSNLGFCKAISTNWEHTVALTKDGTIVGWGLNNYGCLTFPENIGLCTAIAAGINNTLAIQINGTVKAWGDNQWNKSTVPINLGPCIQIAVGPDDRGWPWPYCRTSGNWCHRFLGLQLPRSVQYSFKYCTLHKNCSGQLSHGGYTNGWNSSGLGAKWKWTN